LKARSGIDSGCDSPRKMKMSVRLAIGVQRKGSHTNGGGLGLVELMTRTYAIRVGTRAYTREGGTRRCAPTSGEPFRDPREVTRGRISTAPRQGRGRLSAAPQDARSAHHRFSRARGAGGAYAVREPLAPL